MERGISLYELQLKVKGAVDSAIKELLWVTGEISEIRYNPNGHCYIDLSDYDSREGAVNAKARAVIWSRNAAMLLPYFKTVAGAALERGMHVLLKVQVQYSPLYGLTLNVLDIDPSFTVGEAEINRQRVLKRLEEEGMFGLNGALPLSPLPARLAIISSETAAGYRDFMKHLSDNEYGVGFYTKLFQSPMQGADAPAGIMASFYRIADSVEQGEPFDAVVLIRGGGSVLDLAPFDDYNLALCIAQFPLPVLTGIGHDHDCHAADMVAYRHLKTPTAVAGFILDMYAEQFAYFDELVRRLSEAVRNLTERGENNLARIISALKVNAGAILERERGRVELLEYKVNSLNPLSLLEKGYAILAGADGKRIISLGGIPERGVLKVFMKEGVAELEVKLKSIIES